MNNRNSIRIVVAATAIIVVLLLVSIFWLLGTTDEPNQPQVADSGDEAAKRKLPVRVSDPVGTKSDDTAKKADTPAAEKPPEPARKPETDAVRPEGEVVPGDGEASPGVPGEAPKPKVEGEVDPAKPNGEDDSRPDPEKPITVDFVNRDIHSVFHYIALRSGLNVIVQGSLDTKVTVMLRDKKPRDAIRAICDGNNLELVEDGGSFIVRKNPAASAALSVTRGSKDGLWNVSFEKQPCAGAILEFARTAAVTVFLPSSSTDSDKPISVYLRESTTEDILAWLATLAGWTVTKSDDDNPSWTFKRK
jgi:hypothetical protein